MLNSYFNMWIQSYINDCIERQNDTETIEARNVYTISDYCDIFYPALKIISEHSDLLNENRDYALNAFRTLLYENSRIKEKTDEFINRAGLAAGCNLSYGTKNFRETIVAGNQSEVKYVNGKYEDDVVKMTDRTIFDLASITKLFTALSTLKLVSKGLLDLNTKVVDICPEFTGLKDITVLDLLSFNAFINTNGRVDDAKTPEEAEKVLKTLHVNPNPDYNRPYTDMGAMVLKYVIEKVSNMPYEEFVKENILIPANMTNTYHTVPTDKLCDVAKTSYGTRYTQNPVTSIYEVGELHDPKARLLASKGLTGHAGLFAPAVDMTNLACALISNKIIPTGYMMELAKNRTGKLYIDETNTQRCVQYYGMLCYSKNPIPCESEVHPALSGRAFAAEGFTGTQLTVDPQNGIYVFLGSNRTHNRVFYVDPAYRQFSFMDSNGCKRIMLPNMEEKIDSSRYAYEKDLLLSAAVELSMQYKMLEDLINVHYKTVEDKVHLV